MRGTSCTRSRSGLAKTSTASGTFASQIGVLALGSTAIGRARRAASGTAGKRSGTMSSPEGPAVLLGAQAHPSRLPVPLHQIRPADRPSSAVRTGLRRAAHVSQVLARERTAVAVEANPRAISQMPNVSSNNPPGMAPTSPAPATPNSSSRLPPAKHA